MKAALILSVAIFGVLSVHSVSGSSLEKRHWGGGWDNYGDYGHGHGNGGWGKWGGWSGEDKQKNNDKKKCVETGCSREVEAKNKAMALGFTNEVLGDHNIAAAKKYISDKQYIQHNPAVGDGLAAVEKAMAVWFKDAPKEKMDVRKIICECDTCFVHIKTQDGGKPTAQVDIYRFCPELEGKICEHWDVIQEIPESKENPHPMF